MGVSIKIFYLKFKKLYILENHILQNEKLKYPKISYSLTRTEAYSWPQASKLTLLNFNPP